jgi:hypothetical protein
LEEEGKGEMRREEEVFIDNWRREASALRGERKLLLLWRFHGLATSYRGKER